MDWGCSMRHGVTFESLFSTEHDLLGGIDRRITRE